MTRKDFEEMPEIELVRIINDPESSELEYNEAADVLIRRYEKMIHYHWWKLQKELNGTDAVLAIKEDFYDEAYEALLKAISKVDLSKVKDKNFKILQLASWYITNVRSKFRKQVLKKGSKTQKLVTQAVKEDEDSNTIDSYVEKAYNEAEGYKMDPAYRYEVEEGMENCRKSVKKCMAIWNDDEKEIYRYLESGKNKTEIAGIMGVPTTKIYSMTKKMMNDMKKAMDYNNLKYSY